MSRFAVWAPDATEVEVVFDDGTSRLTRDPERHGWWQADIPSRGPGTRYLYRVDGGPAVPDPRSSRQPDGVHGPSEVVDHSAFAWGDTGFLPPALSDSVLYELHVGTFTDEGTFAAAATRLDHLVDLGITHVEVMPIGAFPGRNGWGYDGVDLFAVHEPYGGPEGLRSFVDACHRRGLAVVLDAVYNHLGPDGNYLSVFGPYFTERYDTPWGEAVNLTEPGSDEVRRFVIDNALGWFEHFHLDGLRLDAVDALLDDTPYHLLEELADETRQLSERLGRPLVLIAENDSNDPRLITPSSRGGYGLDAVWNDDVHHALHVTLTGERTGYYADYDGLGDLAAALEHGYVYEGRFSGYRGRRRGRSLGDLPRSRLLASLQNHDQVGNRAQGDRITQACGLDRHGVGAALLLSGPFLPMLFQGEEWAASTPFPYFSNHLDPELAAAVRRGRREEFVAFGWDPATIPDPQAPETHRSAVLLWDERAEQDHAQMLDWYRQLVALRRSTADLRDGAPEATRARVDAAGVLVVERGDRHVVVANLGSEAASIELGPVELRLGSGGAGLGETLVHVPPDGVAVLRRA